MTARTYERAAEHLKLCFVDAPVRDETFWKQWRGISVAEDPTPPGSVALTTIKKIAWNNNLMFCTAFASGGDSGLCRVQILKGFESEPFMIVKNEILEMDKETGGSSQ